MAETKKYYHNIDADNNKIINPLLNPLTTVQRTTIGGTLTLTEQGYVVFDTTLNQQYFWNGTAWIVVGGSATWGAITGTLTAQTDLTAYLTANYYPLSSNPAGYLTSSALTPYLTSATAALTYEPIIAAGTTSQYWRGDKTWQTFPTIPAAQIQSDWNQTNNTLLDYIKNKPTIPTVGTWGALNYPSWTSGTPFVKMTAAGTFSLDTTSYQPLLTNPVTGTGTATRVAFWDTGSSISSDSALYWDNSNKYLGIGTATPSKALDVISDAKVNGALLGIGPNSGSSFPNSNIVFGTNALAVNTTGYYNAAIGTNAMSANTTGYYNLAIGYDALKVNLISRTNIAIGAASLGKFIGDSTVNGGNTGIGALTLRDNVTGLYNTAIGYGSILSITGSSYNAAIGYSALRYATSGTYNTAIGTYAGSYYGAPGTSTITTVNNGTFIGYYTRPLNNSSTNEIVIGYNAVGNGDNSTTIGNSGTTSTNLFGALGFGSTPSYGTAGQVLTSAGTGTVPTWTTIAASGGTVTSVDLSMPTAFTVSNNPVTTSGTLTVTGAGTSAQYVKGDGSLGTTVTKTSELTNDGDNGYTHFISVEDLPSNLVLYATNVSSGISTYYKLVTTVTDPDYNTTAVNIPTGTITTTSQFIAGLVSPANIIIGNPGTFTVSTIGNIQRLTGTGTATFYFEVWKRDSGGTETLIATSNDTVPVSTGGYIEFTASGLWNNGLFTATDRVVLKFYGNRIPSGSNPTYQFQFGGTSPVRTTVPIPLTVAPAPRSIQSVSTATAAGSNYGIDYIYFVSGTTTITLPTAVGSVSKYTIKNTGTAVVSIATTSSQTIDGSTAPITINTPFVSLDLISDGSNWYII
jgi:hypothetical protein